MKLPDILHHYVVVGTEDAAAQSTSDQKGKAPQLESAAGGTNEDVAKLLSKGKQRVMMAQLIDSIDALKRQKHLYATGKMKHVVSWTDPATMFGLDNVEAGEVLGETTYIVRNAVPSKQLEAIMKNLKLVYKEKIDVQELTAAAKNAEVDIKSSFKKQIHKSITKH
jgi:hypothetical protein